jgi:hypothetical protein
MTIRRNRDLRAFADRYDYDFRKCRPHDGWAQLDTKQDAPYYGNWVNPLTFELLSYCEGDVTHTQCDTADEFKSELAECIAWHREREYFIGIDPCMSLAIEAALFQMGFGPDIHGTISFKPSDI